MLPMLTYAPVCRPLTTALKVHVLRVLRVVQELREDDTDGGAHALTYADVCYVRMLTYAVYRCVGG
jgi:hypothetical protein